MRLITQTETSKGSLTLWSKGAGFEVRLNLIPVFPAWDARRDEQAVRQSFNDYVEVLG